MFDNAVRIVLQTLNFTKAREESLYFRLDNWSHFKTQQFISRLVTIMTLLIIAFFSIDRWTFSSDIRHKSYYETQ